MTTNENTIIIFHRANTNAEESLKNQQKFLEHYNKNFSAPLHVFDYSSPNHYWQAPQLTKLIIKNPSAKFLLILNSHLSREEHEKQYNLYSFFKTIRNIGWGQFYLMDSEGRIFEEAKQFNYGE